MNRRKNSIPATSGSNRLWEFKNSAGNSNEATLYVYGDIVTYDLDDWNWPDDVVPNKFKDELNALGDVNTIHVRINSNGGSVFAAYAIMNMLKNHKAKIITYNDGIAASAATIIAMAGDKIITALGSAWMIHMPMFSLWGYYNANELNKLTGALNTIASSMIDIYHAKTGIDKAELESMMNEETWLTGTKAMEIGLADEVSDFEVVAYLSEDKKTAFFNGLKFDMENLQNTDKFMNTVKLPVKPSEQGSINAGNKGRTGESKNIENSTVKTPGTPLPNNTQEETIMDLNELKSKYPDIYNAAKQEGVVEGTAAERKRIRDIEDMSLPGMEALTSKAKYETAINAEQLAVEIAKDQKQRGVAYISSAAKDAEALDSIPASGAPQDDTQQEQALLAKAKTRAENIRR